MASYHSVIVPTAPPTSRRLSRIQHRVAWAAVIIGTVALVTSLAIRFLINSTQIKGVLRVLSSDLLLAFVLHGVQALTIFCFVMIHKKWLHHAASQLTDAMPVARDTLEQFKNGWVYMWYCWVALYAWFFLTAPWSTLPRIQAVSDILDVVSGFNIWWCFLVLDMPSVNQGGRLDRDRNFRRTAWIIGIGGAFCASLGAIDRLYDWNHFGVVVGLYNALALAFLTGCLGNPYIRVPRRILLCLYLYAMLQLFYSFLPLLKTAIWLPIVFLSALALKIAVAYAGFHMLQNGGLQKYLYAAQALAADERPTSAAAAVATVRSSWTSPLNVLTSIFDWGDNPTLDRTDKWIMRLISIIDFRRASFYLAILAISALMATIVTPVHFLTGRTFAMVFGLFVGISSGLALLKEGFSSRHYAVTRIGFIAAAFLMFMETILVFQLGLHLHHQ